MTDSRTCTTQALLHHVSAFRSVETSESLLPCLPVHRHGWSFPHGAPLRAPETFSCHTQGHTVACRERLQPRSPLTGQRLLVLEYSVQTTRTSPEGDRNSVTPAKHVNSTKRTDRRQPPHPNSSRISSPSTVLSSSLQSANPVRPLPSAS